MVSQFDKDDVEAVGLVKFDFLGLTTLTILDWTMRLHQRDGGEVDSVARRRVPRPSPSRRCRSTIREAYKVFASANTTAVFQFESRGMRDLLKRAKPDRFEDIIALVALYRPGPMELIPEFIERKHGRKRVRLSRPAAGADPETDLRHHGVPGAGDADRAGDRRLHARRRRPAAPRDGQEEARGDGQAARHLRRRRASSNGFATRQGQRSSST